MSPEYLEKVYNSFADPDGLVLLLHATSGAGEVGANFLPMKKLHLEVNLGEYRVWMFRRSTASLIMDCLRRYRCDSNGRVAPAGVLPATPLR
jgi:hypothetical protein